MNAVLKRIEAEYETLSPFQKANSAEIGSVSCVAMFREMPGVDEDRLYQPYEEHMAAGALTADECWIIPGCYPAWWW